jgi:hypothetical protein
MTDRDPLEWLIGIIGMRMTAPIPSYPMAFIGCARWISKEHSLNDSRWRAVYM